MVLFAFHDCFNARFLLVPSYLLILIGFNKIILFDKSYDDASLKLFNNFKEEKQQTF